MRRRRGPSGAPDGHSECVSKQGGMTECEAKVRQECDRTVDTVIPQKEEEEGRCVGTLTTGGGTKTPTGTTHKQTLSSL